MKSGDFDEYAFHAKWAKHSALHKNSLFVIFCNFLQFLQNFTFFAKIAKIEKIDFLTFFHIFEKSGSRDRGSGIMENGHSKDIVPLDLKFQQKANRKRTCRELVATTKGYV